MNKNLKKFEAALKLFGADKDVVNFHKEIEASDMPPGEKNFWMCVCNEIEDVKFKFFKHVEGFVASSDDISMTNFQKFMSHA